jgi:ligand-binding sensor domain-containing protein
MYIGVKDGLYYSLNNGSSFIASNVTDTIISIEKDYFGAVWFGGINSLYRHSPAVSISQTSFNEVESVNDMVFPIYAIEKDNVTQGHVVFGSKKGLLFISDPKINKILFKDNYLFVATTEGIFRIKLDGSRNWVDVTDVFTNAAYYDIIKAVKTNELIACADYGIIISDDNGASWMQYFVSSSAIIQLVEVNTGPDEGIYAVSSSKIYKSIDNGYNWSEYLSIEDFESVSEFRYFFAELSHF